MKFGLRTPSWKRSWAARTSWRRALAAKTRMPRGWGWIRNPHKALYNRIYNRSTFSLGRLLTWIFG
jgi:hypothetical protein